RRSHRLRAPGHGAERSARCSGATGAIARGMRPAAEREWAGGLRCRRRRDLSFNDDARRAERERERSLREEAFRRWSLAWQPMDAETIDAYVEATLDEPMDALIEALRRLARAHAGPYRPAPAVVIDRIYDVMRERRDRHDVPALPAPRLDRKSRLDVWDSVIAKARASGVKESSRQMQSYLRGRERHAKLAVQDLANDLADDLL